MADSREVPCATCPSRDALTAATMWAKLSTRRCRKARASGETEKLADAFADMEREVGAAFEPILRRMADALARWRNRGS